MKQGVISIITSAYNAEATLENAVKSVLAQTWNDFEYLLVDHGSTDSTKDIINSFAQKDHRIRPLYIKKNTGCIGKALNFALEQAVGEYVCFLDADDWLEPEYMESLYTSAEAVHADVSICGFRIVDQHKEELSFYMYDAFSDHNIIQTRQEWKDFYLKSMQKQHTLALTLVDVWWNKLYRREFLNKHKLKFYETTDVYNDSHFNYDVFSLYPKAVIINQMYYVYYRQENATIFHYRLGGYIGRMEYVQRWNHLLKDLPVDRAFYINSFFCAFYWINTANANIDEKIQELCSWITHPVFLEYYTSKKIYAVVTFELEFTLRLLMNDNEILLCGKITDYLRKYYQIVQTNLFNSDNLDAVLDIIFEEDNIFSLGAQWLADYVLS